MVEPCGRDSTQGRWTCVGNQFNQPLPGNSRVRFTAIQPITLNNLTGWETSLFLSFREGIHRLVGILTQPSAGVAARGEVVVLVHGGMANKNSFYHKHLASKLASEGFHVFRCDFVGNGESEPIFKAAADGTDTTEAYRNMMSGFWLDVEDLAR